MQVVLNQFGDKKEYNGPDSKFCNPHPDMLLHAESLMKELDLAIPAYADVIYVLRTEMAEEQSKTEKKVVDPSTIYPPLSLCIDCFLKAYKKGMGGGFIFPEFSKLCVLALIIPLSSVDCERGFSLMNIIKTDLRAHMNSTTLCALMRIALGVAEADFPFEDAADWWFQSPRSVKPDEAVWLEAFDVTDMM